MRRALLLLLPLVLAAAPYRWEVETPHWPWVNHHAGGTVRALFIVNYQSQREPAELAQRFDLEATVVPVRGNAYGNQWDEPALLAALEQPWDVIVLAAREPQRDLNEASRDAIRAALAGGTGVAVFARGHQAKLIGDWLAVTPEPLDVDIPLPVDRMQRRGAFALQQAGKVLFAPDYDLHWTFFGAFLPLVPVTTENGWVAELNYALAARVIRRAAGKAVEAPPVVVPETATLGQPLTLEAPPGTTVRHQLYSRFGDPVNVPRGGELLCVWQLDRDDATLDCGAAVVTVPAPTLANVQAIPAAVSWDPLEIGTVEAQVLDPDGRVVSLATAPAAAGRVALPPWPAPTPSFCLRLVLHRAGTILDEQRAWLTVPIDRAADVTRFNAIVWGTERGDLAERWRFPILRGMGLDAIAPIGTRPDLAEGASRTGLRLVPTNVFVPQDDEAKVARSVERLTAYMPTVGPLQPLGYSLADEPQGVDLVAWRERAAALIRPEDPGARIGFCGVWTRGDLARLLGACNFMTPYSPEHLYTPNLWLGVERDLYRCLRAPGGLLTCWTHYAPRSDHEPYSRTVPWLWLFEEMNGVSYFDSAGNFAILPPELSQTHEARWFGEELARMDAGIAAQVLHARRDRGTVRVVFERLTGNVALWLRALDRAAVPYRVVPRDWLTGDEDAEMIIAVDVFDVTDAQLAGLERRAAAGAQVWLGAGFATLRDGQLAPLDRLQGLCGIVRTAVFETVKDWEDRRKLLADVPATVGDLTGETLGEAGLTLADGEVAGAYTKLGAATGPADEPEFIQALFATPATVRRGSVQYCTVQPDLEALARLCTQPIPERVTIAGKSDDTIYLYPFTDGPIRLLGVIQDYWRIDPAETVEDKNTAAYWEHGPQRWDSRPAHLELTAAAHIYDVRQGRYLGHGTGADFTLQPGRPELFALLPYQVGDMELAAAADVRQGERLPVRVALDAAGPHVIDMVLAGPTGDRLRERAVLEDGRAEVTFAIPYNAAAGVWQLAATDAVSGTTAGRAVTVQLGAAIAVPPVHLTPRVARVPLDLPPGEWRPYVPPDARPVAVTVRVGAPRRGHFQGTWWLNGSLTLSNPDITYSLKYRVDNDYQAHGWDDPRRIEAPYLPGLGFTRPQPHMWYYNGYLEVFADDRNVTDWAVKDIREVPAGENGRVDVVWDSPAGDLMLSFLLRPRDLACYQRLEFTPAQPIRTLRLRFRSYPKGFSNQGREWHVTEQEHGRWHLMGNALLDPAYGKGRGSGAILVQPERWTEVTFSRTTTLVDERDEPSAVTRTAYWALWMFPDLSNDDALRFIRMHAPETAERLEEIWAQ